MGYFIKDTISISACQQSASDVTNANICILTSRGKGPFDQDIGKFYYYMYQREKKMHIMYGLYAFYIEIVLSEKRRKRVEWFAAIKLESIVESQ